MTTALDLFSSAVREKIAPTLRAAGLQGSGGSYYLPSKTHFALLGFQKSQSSTSADVRFTINLKVVSLATWQQMRDARPDFPPKPAPNTRYGTFEWHKRIGELLPNGEDTWWHFRAGRDNSATIAEVIDDLIKVAVPAIRRQLETATL